MAAKRVQESEYSRYYGAFRGVDFSNDESQVSPARFSYARNMYKDYDSGQGVAVETIAGYRKRGNFGNRKIYGIHKSAEKGENGEPVFYVHCGFELYRTADWGKKTLVYNAMNEHFSKSFVLYGRLYILDGANYLVVKDGTVESVKDGAPYIPTTYINIVASGANANAGTEYEQRNILSPYFKNTFLWKGETDVCYLSERDVESVSNVKLFGTVINAFDREKAQGICYSFKKENFRSRIHISINPTISGMTAQEIDAKDVVRVYAKNVKVVEFCPANGAGPAYDIAVFDKQTDVQFLFIRRMWTEIAGFDKPSGAISWAIFALDHNGDVLLRAFYHGGSKKLVITDSKGTETVKEVVEDGPYWFRVVACTRTYAEGGGEISLYVTLGELESRELSFISGEAEYFSSDSSNLEIIAKKTYRSLDGTELPPGKDISAAITGCTEVTIFDGRVFMSGNPLFPNSIFYCSFNNVTGYADPTYFGVLNRVRDGFDATAITGMIPLGDTLMTLKEDSEQDGIIYYHTPTSGGNDLTPTVYPSKQGAVGAGCIAGSCANFNDEPVFLTRLGLRAVTKLSTNLERSIEERSSNINGKLLKSDLKNAQLAEWNGYLCILVDGDMYMADSRQRYQDEVGRLQYEWYYISKLGQYEGQFDEYRYSGSMPEEFAGATVQYTAQGMQYEAFLKLADAVYFPDLYVTENLCGQVANEPFADGGERIPIYSAEIEGKAVSFVPDANDPRVVYLCETKGAKIGGRFCPATVLKSQDGNIFFGTENGYVYSFNFDLRDVEGKIPINAYNFDGRAIECGIATVMDNCGIPHMTKTTVKHSTVLKTKAFKNSCIKFKVRTNDNAYKAVQTVNSGIFSFDDVDFSDLTFNVGNKTIFAIREKEKRWVEKQYYLYSDEPNKPFGVYNAAFRYRLAGRYKS